ncbi:hypothetical protein ONS95_005793 [Cadophora gregata]|uniref:uncharacterized protein n=1 Tax=Cadophora gregata TaxID=51156 RepID=UPI0026DB6CF8|nr:uncharacterized protein ONS95_005793 [Cadophora gregata]KAK0103791.1 hypothetical protein ONS95_005793 [Cadophora gregata]
MWVWVWVVRKTDEMRCDTMLQARHFSPSEMQRGPQAHHIRCRAILSTQEQQQQQFLQKRGPILTMLSAVSGEGELSVQEGRDGIVQNTGKKATIPHDAYSYYPG